jgi:hypothetical protein
LPDSPEEILITSCVLSVSGVLIKGVNERFAFVQQELENFCFVFAFKLCHIIHGRQPKEQWERWRRDSVKGFTRYIGRW